VLIEQRPITIVTILRLCFLMSPMLNMLLSMTNIRFREYMIGSFLGLLPVLIVLVRPLFFFFPEVVGGTFSERVELVDSHERWKLTWSAGHSERDHTHAQCRGVVSDRKWPIKLHLRTIRPQSRGVKMLY
jgi:hypothetical protein